MNLLKKLVVSIARKLPRNSGLFNLFKLYVDNYQGNNNSDMMSNGEYFILKNILSKSKVVFDIGANVGDWTQLALSINGNLNIHCFEPSEKTFNQLNNKKFPKNVVLNNFGLSSSKKQATLHVFDDGSGLNSLYQRRGLEDGFGLQTQKRTETISLDTLENYCKEKKINIIDFMKIDVEGHELDVLKGAESLFRENKIKIVQFEYGGTNIDSRTFLMDYFEFFKEYNYNFYKIHPNFIELVKRYDQLLDNFLYQNWLIIRKK